LGHDERLIHPLLPTAMYVCVCNAITDREVRGAVALGARSLADLQSTLGVATCCRRCADCAVGLVSQVLCEQAERVGGDD
jgi:bacterioferritin-associated ferredoxin